MAQLASTTVYGDLVVTNRILGSLNIGADSSADEIIRVRSQNFAGLELHGDTADLSGEPGGAYVRLSQDGGKFQGIFGIVNSAGTDGSGDTFTGAVANYLLLGHKHNYGLHLGTNNNVQLTITTSGDVGVGTTSPSHKLDVSGTARVTGALTLGTQASSTGHAVRADRQITAGDGLTGGGNLTANRSLAVDSTVVRTSGNQTIGGTKTFSSAVVLSTAGTSTSHAVRADRQITAGDGLSGGGNLTANRTLSVDSTVVRTTGSQTIGGAKTFSSGVTINGTAPTLHEGTGSPLYINFSGTEGTDRSYIILQGVNANNATNENSGAFIQFRTSTSAGYGAFIGGHRKSSGASALVFKTGSQNPGTTMYLDESGNLGIGTTSPSHRLDVSGTARVTGALTLGTQASSTSHAVRADRQITAGDGLTGGGNLTANRNLAVDSSVVRTSGNQTIGGTKTFSSAVVLSTAGTSASHAVRADRSITIQGETNITVTGGTQNLTANRTWTLGWSGVLSVARGGTGRSSLTTGRILFGAGTSQVGLDGSLFWDNSNKRLGIGTASPSANLHVNGDARLGATTLTGKLQLNNNAAEASLNIPRLGTSNPSTTEDGDLWYRSNNLYYNNNGTIRTIAHTSSWSAMSVAEIEAGTATTSRFMRADRLKYAIEYHAGAQAKADAAEQAAKAYTDQEVGAHEGRTDNPHSVTAAQVGAFPANLIVASVSPRENSPELQPGAMTYVNGSWVAPIPSGASNLEIWFVACRLLKNFRFRIGYALEYPPITFSPVYDTDDGGEISNGSPLVSVALPGDASTIEVHIQNVAPFPQKPVAAFGLSFGFRFT